MSVVQAAYDTVHGYEQGTSALAEGVGIGKQVLINKVNPQNTTHHLTLDEAVRLMKFTRDVRVMHALADELQGVFVPLPNASEATGAVMGDISRMSLEFGSLLKEVAADIADGEISPNEFKRIQREASGLREALTRLMSDLLTMQSTSVPRIEPGRQNSQPA